MSTSSQILKTPIQAVAGIGPQRAALLGSELGIYNLGDLADHFPFRYEDRSHFQNLGELRESSVSVLVRGTLSHPREIPQKRGKRLTAELRNGPHTLELVWFRNYQYILKKLKPGHEYVAFGKVSSFGSQLNMAHPELESLEEYQSGKKGPMQPVYPSTEKLTKTGVSNRVWCRWAQNLLPQVLPHLEETLPSYLLRELALPGRSEAYSQMHFPASIQQAQQARYRLKFEELFYLQLELVLKNLIHKARIRGIPFERVGDHFNQFYSQHLPFELTGAQKRVIREIRKDLGSGVQMNRLLQGDVGSGKTMVALLSMLISLDNDCQACLVSPTEILAQQHFTGLSEYLSGMGIEVRLLTGSVKGAERRKVFEGLRDGSIPIVVGTHALFEDRVVFRDLGLAIIDEQHRFGVAQRSKLWQKRKVPPHILVMTATPIPRTLAMSVYGDLDISVIDELPPGRKPVKTEHRFDSHRLKVFRFLKDQINEGRQVYIVYPLISESSKLDYKDLMDGYESITREFPQPKYQVSIVHGQMSAEFKDYEMQRFVEGETQIMVATTVIEVGVNVPNASVMVIESAERFGLSQLHQLRGRVGRGANQSYCILMTSHALSDDARTRLETMVRTQDGFEISEVDLKLRGPGDILGTQQSGVLALKVADLVKDQAILIQAREWVKRILEDDPKLEKPINERIRFCYSQRNQGRLPWSFIS